MRLLRRLRAVHGHVAAATAVIGGEEVELIPHDEPREHSDSVGTFERSERWTPDGHRNPGSRGAGPALLQDEQGVVLPEELERLQREQSGLDASRQGRGPYGLHLRCEEK